MLLACALLVVVSALVSLIAVGTARRISMRRQWLDAQGVAGQVKAPPRRVPNTGGVGIFLGIALPMLAGLIATQLLGSDVRVGGSIMEALREHVPGIVSQAPLAIALLLATAVMHVMGVIDDRRPLGWRVKLGVMALGGLAMALPVAGLYDQTRMLTFLDAHVGGSWLSVAVTVAWFIVIANAMNFMDNMDGLSAGVAAVAGACFLATAIITQQWFVAMTLALLVGSCIGFLFWNRPPAKIFMGDGGSLVLGFLLAFLAVRTTYFNDPSRFLNQPVPNAPVGWQSMVPEGYGRPWYATLTPLLILAVPLYDFASVCVIRLRQGRSPFVGDLQHFSHRLVRRGLSRRAAVAVICALTACTGIGGIAIGSLEPWQASLVAAQTLLLLAVLAAFEGRATRTLHADDPLHPDKLPKAGSSSAPLPTRRDQRTM